MISCSFPTLVIIPTIICCFRCCFIFDFSNLRSYILYSKGGISFSACTPFDYKLAELFSLIVHPCMHPISVAIIRGIPAVFPQPSIRAFQPFTFLAGVRSDFLFGHEFGLLFVILFVCNSVEHQLLQGLCRFSHVLRGQDSR